MPRLSRFMITESLSRIRITIDSPWTLGSVTTRRSTECLSIDSPTRPPWGGRRRGPGAAGVLVERQADAAVLRDATLGDVEVGHDLHAADDAGEHATRDRRRLHQHAVDPAAHEPAV